jgi:hypothetical protein
MNVDFKSEIGSLAEWEGGPCSTIMIATHRTGREASGDPIRYRNQLRRAQEQLAARGLRGTKALRLLDPALKLSEDPFFWEHQDEGLAVFTCQEWSRHFCIPYTLPEISIVQDRPYLVPLFPLLGAEDVFYVLASSQTKTRLLKGSRYHIQDRPLEVVGINEALGTEPREEHLQFHTAAPSGARGQGTVYHGQGGPSEEAKERLLAYFRMIDDRVSQVMVNGLAPAPLILAMVDYLQPIYRQASKYKNILSDGITGNPDELSENALHQAAWNIVAQYSLQPQREAIATYLRLAGSGHTSSDITEILRAAHEGRVASLLMSKLIQQWGVFDSETNDTLLLGDAPGSIGEELLNLAAVQTILHGGQVYTLGMDQTFGESPLAAVFRY